MPGIQTVIVVGFGNMGKALVRGLQKAQAYQVCISDRFQPPDAAALRADGIQPEQVHWIPTSESHKAQAYLGPHTALILAIKPQNLSSFAQDWHPVLVACEQPPLVVSILAGIPTRQLEGLLPARLPVVRAMPNIAATVDCAATAVCAGSHASAQHLDFAREIFDVVGKTWITTEENLNAVTGLSGSGPAYIYMVIEALSDGGVKMGLPRQVALELATQTVIGAGLLVQETKLHPAILRDQVTTPGGTTISAIHELEKHGLRPMLMQAVVTATEKSAELATHTAEQNPKRDT
jgi:pyrroline-5-carboxylate reductase